MHATSTAPGAAAPSGPDAGMRREWLAPFRLDARLILSVHRRGRRDPAFSVEDSGAVWRTSLTPDGPGTVRVTGRGADDGTLVTGQAWGPGAAWLLDTLPAQLGAQDDLSGFTARHPVVGELVLRHPGLRVGRTSRVFEALVPAVLEQKVVGLEAHRAWRILLGRSARPPRGRPRRHAGLPAPGHVGAHPVLGLAPGRSRGRPGPDHHHRGRRGGPARADQRP